MPRKISQKNSQASPQGITAEITPNVKQAKAWEHWFDSRVMFLGYGGGGGGGKIVANDGVVLTPFGWKKGQNLKVGDLICSPSGGVQRIIQIKPEVEIPLWRVHFSDGVYTDVAKDHLWFAWKGGKSRKILNNEHCGETSGEVVETQELASWIKRGYHPQIPVSQEVSFNVSTREKNRIDPYLLGALLGDGCFTNEKHLLITCSESDKEHYKNILGTEDISYVSHNTIRFNGKKKEIIFSKLNLHGLVGCYSNTKFIPRTYLYGSIEDRYALARGLMDTDGYKPKEKNGAYFYTVSKQLAEDACFLFRSLGAVVTITKDIGKYKKDGKEYICQEVFNLYIKHRNPDALFSMQRKKRGSNPVRISRIVSKVEQLDQTIKGRCITVSGRDGLYITNDFIVTHNSWFGCELLLVQAYKYPNTRSFIARNELKRLMQSTFVTWNKVCAHHKIPQDDWKLNGQYNFIEFRNGSRIDLLDVAKQPSDPLYERFGSLEYTNGWVEEAGEVDFLAFDVLKSRIGRWKNRDYDLTPKMLLTFNPKKGWLYEMFYKPWTQNALPEHIKFIQALYTDNPHTRDEYGRMLAEIKDKATRQRLMEGNWDYDDDPTVLIRYDALIDLWTNTLDKDDRMAITADVARYGSDRTVICLWKGLEVTKCIHYEKRGIDETATEIRTLAQKHQVPYSRIVVDEDGVGGGVCDALRGIKGYIANSSPLPDRVGRSTNFQNLKSQCSYLFAEYVNDHKIAVKIDDTFVKDRIKEDLEQIKSYDADKDGKRKVLPKDKVKEVLGRSPDFGDALVMRMLLELKDTGDGSPLARFGAPSQVSFKGVPLTRFASNG